MGYMTFHKISKQYTGKNEAALKSFDLTIQKGEFIVIIGPSGSGKSTLLDIICGFEQPTTGQIYLDDNEITPLEPKARDLAMVFQNYALFPHMTVYENIAFGMKIRKVPKKEREEKVIWAAQLLGLESHLKQKPKHLSGGERQRVALARAMVREPKVFLMDEPLSHLDAKLKYSTANQITSLHKTLKATTLYVTHDQTEAMTMADRLVVLNKGEIMQIGTPYEIYHRPENLFVATFIGYPQMNLFEARLRDNQLILNEEIIYKDNKVHNKNIPSVSHLGLRPEHIQITYVGQGDFDAQVMQIAYLGSEQILHLQYKNSVLIAKISAQQVIKVGETVGVSMQLANMHLFEMTTGIRIGD